MELKLLLKLLKNWGSWHMKNDYFLKMSRRMEKIKTKISILKSNCYHLCHLSTCMYPPTYYLIFSVVQKFSMKFMVSDLFIRSQHDE